MKIETINVVEQSEGGIISVRSFSKDLDGRKQAEELFIQCIKDNFEDEENKLPDEKIKDYLDAESYFDDDYHVSIWESL